MKLLLDTHLLLWAAGEPKRLSKQARTLIDNPDNELLFSAASFMCEKRLLTKSEALAKLDGLARHARYKKPILEDARPQLDTAI
jgi:PIN domain nuclease of toxin-antitoxin system